MFSYTRTVNIDKAMKRTAEDKLLELGMHWLRRGGVRGLSVRGICAEAGVSPGTFTSYFKTLREFADRLLEQWYEPLKEEVERHRSDGGNAYERLRSELQASSHFFHKNAAVMMQLIIDASKSQESVQDLLHAARLSHMSWLNEAIAEAQAEGYIVKEPVERVMLYLFGAINFPCLLYQLMPEQGLPKDAAFFQVMGGAADEKSALQRLDWALQGIRVK